MSDDPLRQRESQARLDFVHTYLAMQPRQRLEMMRQLLIDLLDVEEQGYYEDFILDMLQIVEGQWEAKIKVAEERVQRIMNDAPR